MSRPSVSVDQAFRQFHAAMNAINNVMEIFYNTNAEQGVTIQMQAKKIEDLARQLKEFEPPKKIEPKTPES